MPEILIDYLKKSVSLPFKWGVCDCCLWAADWVKFSRGVDIALNLRSMCSNKHEAESFVELRGGLLEICSSAFYDSGLLTVTQASVGDIALVNTPVGKALVIRTKIGWAWKAKFGFSVVSVDKFVPIKIWKVL